MSKSTDYIKTILRILSALFLLSIPVGIILFLNSFENTPQGKVPRAKADLRTLLGALEAYQVDHGCYPAWANGARGANKFLKSSHESYAIPTFRVYAAKDEFFASLTTPTPYITSFPHDSFAPGGKSGVSYGYYTTGSCWLLFSAGRDMRYDIDPIKDFIPGGDNTILIMKTYDPTNGTYSAGDIFRMKLE